VIRRIEARRSLVRLAARPGPGPGDHIRVAILVGGVVGDSIMAARFLRDLRASCGDLQFDIYSANIHNSEWIFSGVGERVEHFQDSVFEAVAPDYDAALFFSDSVSLWGRKPDAVARRSPELAAVLDRLATRAPPIEADPDRRHRRECGLSQEIFFSTGNTRARISQFLAGIDYGGPEYSLPTDDGMVRSQGLSGKKFVTVHNGYSTAEISTNRTSTKSYLKFAEVLDLVRLERNDLVFVQIGAHNSVRIETADLILLEKTTLRQAAGLIKAAVCHLDNESGLVTVASCFGAPTCVVYGPTSADYFAYPGNRAVRPVECGGCWWTSRDWMTRCPRGMAAPICMDSQPPLAVAAALLDLIRLRGV
jgi:hypothetical protein